MKVLFKDSRVFYHINYFELSMSYISDYPNIDLSNVPHLNDAEVLYHYIDDEKNRFPVYYEYSGKFITDYGGDVYNTLYIYADYIKDYTLVNLKLI